MGLENSIFSTDLDNDMWRKQLYFKYLKSNSINGFGLILFCRNFYILINNIKLSQIMQNHMQQTSKDLHIARNQQLEIDV